MSSGPFVITFTKAKPWILHCWRGSLRNTSLVYPGNGELCTPVMLRVIGSTVVEGRAHKRHHRDNWAEKVSLTKAFFCAICSRGRLEQQAGAISLSWMNYLHFFLLIHILMLMSASVFYIHLWQCWLHIYAPWPNLFVDKKIAWFYTSGFPAHAWHEIRQNDSVKMLSSRHLCKDAPALSAWIAKCCCRRVRVSCYY